MRIKKTFQGSLPENTVVNTQSDSQTNAYSCEYANDHFGGVVLYNNSTGTNGTVTLSDNISNYKYIEIFGYSNLFNSSIYTKYDVNLGKKINLSHLTTNGSQNRLQTAIYTANGTRLTLDNAYMNVIFGTAVNNQTNNNEFYITKVVGYK